MVDVRMRKYHCVNRWGREEKPPVPLFRFLSPALKHAAIEQITFAVHFELMHGAGDSPSRAREREFHSPPAYRGRQVAQGG
jgi:hypothetical protein